MKKLCQIFILLLFLAQPCYALTLQNPLNYFFNDQKAIKRVLTSQVHYANRANLKKYLSFFDSDYKSGDGLDLDKYSSLTKEVWDNYQNIKYQIIIDDINVSGKNAVVKIKEMSGAKVTTKENFEGVLESEAYSLYYLRKNNGKWKIYSDKTLDETTKMLYGNTQGIEYKLTVPKDIKANTEYCTSLEFTPPQDTIAIASLTVDLIEYPQTQTQEVFRPFPQDNILERLFTANSKNLNEYVIATIGFTKSEICDISIKLSLSGYGYVIKRVNVIPIEDKQQGGEQNVKEK